MTTELWYLFLTAVLLAVLWIPYIIGQVQTAGLLTPKDYVEGREVELPHWVRRANRAHINMVEQFGAFAALVVIAHLAGISNSVTVLCAAAFFWLRLLHAIVFITGFSKFMARTILFTLSFLSLLVFALQILIGAA